MLYSHGADDPSLTFVRGSTNRPRAGRYISKSQLSYQVSMQPCLCCTKIETVMVTGYQFNLDLWRSKFLNE